MYYSQKNTKFYYKIIRSNQTVSNTENQISRETRLSV